MTAQPDSLAMDDTGRHGAAAATAWALLGAAALAVALVYRDSLQAMARVWGSYEYGHGYLIPFVSLWLLWRERHALAATPIRPWPAAALPLALCGAAWLLGRLAGVNLVEQLSLVAMLPCLVGLVLGWRQVWAAAFPFLFLFLAVPFGDGFIPVLTDMTADATAAALRWTGVPMYRTGNQFVLPTGTWSVVEACSGMRYLLATIPLACVFAYLTYRSNLRRLAFVAVAVLVAIAANWLRAYIVILIGHFSQMRYMTGDDHLWLGWALYGVVLSLLFWVGTRWGEDGRENAERSARGLELSASAHWPSFASAAVAGIAVAALWHPLSSRLLDQGTASVDMARFAAVISPDGPGAAYGYAPSYSGGIAVLSGHAVGDPKVRMVIRHYLQQHRHGEMASGVNRVVEPAENNVAWRLGRKAQHSLADGPARGQSGAVNEYLLEGPDGRLLVWEWFWVNGQTTHRPAVVKLLTARDLLLGRGDESIAFVAWVPVESSPDAARARLARVAGDVRSMAMTNGRKDPA